MKLRNVTVLRISFLGTEHSDTVIIQWWFDFSDDDKWTGTICKCINPSCLPQNLTTTNNDSYSTRSKLSSNHDHHLSKQFFCKPIDFIKLHFYATF